MVPGSDRNIEAWVGSAMASSGHCGDHADQLGPPARTIT
jgi:hypothetical protein